MLGLRTTCVKKVGATVSAVAVAAGLVLAGAPAAGAAPASYPTKQFDVSDGSGSYYTGTITWYNRSVAVAGTFKAVGCRRVYAAAFAGSTQLDVRSSSTHCNSTTAAPIPLDADVPGGAGAVDIRITDAYGNVLDEEVLFRP